MIIRWLKWLLPRAPVTSCPLATKPTLCLTAFGVLPGLLPVWLLDLGPGPPCLLFSLSDSLAGPWIHHAQSQLRVSCTSGFTCLTLLPRNLSFHCQFRCYLLPKAFPGLLTTAASAHQGMLIWPPWTFFIVWSLSNYLVICFECRLSAVILECNACSESKHHHFLCDLGKITASLCLDFSLVNWG